MTEGRYAATGSEQRGAFGRVYLFMRSSPYSSRACRSLCHRHSNRHSSAIVPAPRANPPM